MHWFPLLGSLKNLTTSRGWGDGGGDGGGTREQCGSNKRCTGFPFLGSLKNLTTGLIWLVTRVGGGRRGEVAHGGRARGGEWGGGTKKQCGSKAPLKT